MNVVIRTYTPADLESCRALWAELTEHHRQIYDDPTIGGEQSGLAFDAHLARIELDRIWVAEANGTVYGLVGLIVEGDEGEVEPIVVTTAQRGKGVGHALLTRVRQEAEVLKLRFLGMKPVARNLDAIRFFYQAGFQLLGHVELFTDISPSSGRPWKEGIVLHGHRLKY
ncbi:MAG TPA: GNAT family N-acetyltransferase [Candidatus Binatia bacterium]|jgi:N-acetylglutamate synthase-like GNAT family acetyltransferase|nr:GNAT family N-acetyltransferase [Candidatus Binatia bacterium]